VIVAAAAGRRAIDSNESNPLKVRNIAILVSWIIANDF